MRPRAGIRRRSRVAAAMGVAVLVALASACSGGGDSAGSNSSSNLETKADRPPATTGVPADDLRTAAVAWAHAFLTGTLDDIHALQGPECRSSRPSPLGPKALRGYLRALRTAMAHTFGRPLDQIAIRDVAERNVTSTGGEAEVQYELPESVAGNDNWVTFRVHDGQWKVSNCNAPIGGHTTSASGSSGG